MPSEYYVDLSIVQSELEALQNRDSPEEGESEIDARTLLDLNEELTVVDERVNKAKDYATRLDSTLASSLTGHVFVNGKHYNLDDVSVLKYGLGLTILTQQTGLPEAYANRNRSSIAAPAREGPSSSLRYALS